MGMSRTHGRTLDGLDHVRQSIADILTTPKGSRVMLRDYGSDLPRLIDRPLGATLVADVAAETAGALARWEPRIRVSRVRVTSAAPADGHLELTLEAVYRPDGRPLVLEGIIL
ncbi:GPW/gp25 family protein (plasmid) [Tistrella mobilis]|uniref:GPW/gp25 family protein n=1 Tax=Tistrella mobilis TaxID=171437 RepID=UPI0035572A1A